MRYNFDIIGVTTVWDFFRHQQQVEQSPDRSCAYLGSYECTLDGFIEATQTVQQKPAWDWDAIVAQMVNFWICDGESVSRWKEELQRAEETSLVVGRVANFTNLRNEFEHLLGES